MVRRVQKGTRFTVIYRSWPAFQIVPLGQAEQEPVPLCEDPLYEAGPVGASNDGRRSATHDDETLTLIRLRLSLSAAEAWWGQIDASPRVRWERIDGTRFERALELLFRHRDKDYSFTDCTSFALTCAS